MRLDVERRQIARHRTSVVQPDLGLNVHDRADFVVMDAAVSACGESTCTQHCVSGRNTRGDDAQRARRPPFQEARDMPASLGGAIARDGRAGNAQPGTDLIMTSLPLF
jgi:hypothetical protein